MPQLATPLNDIKVKNAKPQDKPYKLSDGGGLYLLVNPGGNKYWRLAYRSDTKQKTLALGVYPVVTLKDAREKTLAARKLLDAGIDPAKDRDQKRNIANATSVNTFEKIAREWHQRKTESSWQPQTSVQSPRSK